MFVACGIWCLADVSSVSPSLEQSAPKKKNSFFSKLVFECEFQVLSDFRCLKSFRDSKVHFRWKIPRQT